MPPTQTTAPREAGLIARKDYGVVPPKVEYRLTPVGRGLVPIVAAIRRWGARYLNGDRPLGERQAGALRPLAKLEGEAVNGTRTRR
jgi:DNA-binding HxlR family transcriptional regulator